MNGKKLYEFGRFKLDAEERLLFDGANSIQLPPKIFDTLLMLVENAGRSVEKDAMMRQIWSDSFVEENNLAQNISILRKTLGDVGFIETVPKRGYRFAAQVRIIEDAPNRFVAERTSFRVRETNSFEEEKRRKGEEEIESIGSKDSFSPFSTALELAPAKPETRYAQNGDVNIAYQVVGDGDLDVVFVMGWVSHLEYFWEEPHFAAFLNRLASFSRLILFDKRGTGLSDRVPVNELPTLEQRMEDVHAVMDAVGSERAALIGVSEGGPMCSLFAATYPERTLALTMIGTYAKRIWAEDYPWAPTAEQREQFYELMRRDWGKPVGIEDRAPSLANDEHFRNWWATYLRMGASPGAALALTKMNADIDVRNVLPTIQVPTLVIHRSGDACLKVEEGRFVASQIPGCKYVELPGIDHLPFVGNQEEILEEIEEFLTGVRHAPEYDSVLATVMQLCIVNPAQQAEIFGRERWENIVSRSANFVRHQIQLFKGREVSYDEHGVLATFDGPARAVRCAQAISNSAQRLGIRVKTGLHTGECDLIGEKVGGVSVRLAEAVADEAAINEILVSRTVKDLVAGSGLQFVEYGVKSFANLPGEWQLFKVKENI
ncbi:MAG TPA: alpha/beta fold hydrolase [Pyrinomonadaceae bacterium]|jgi:pimeloyl-ACP methyl ester carboxylesterase/DNA-binding winged helix-turn-helix (wHTH) protein/class 3 adenylate cyclase